MKTVLLKASICFNTKDNGSELKTINEISELLNNYSINKKQIKYSIKEVKQ